MIKRKNMVKFLMVMMLLVVIILPGCGESYDGVDVFHNGKGTAIVTIKSDASPEEFNLQLKDFISGVTLMSGYRDIVKVRSVEKTENGYKVDLKLRRIDKIVLNGAIERKEFAQFARTGSQNRALIEKLNKGNISCTETAFYYNRIGQVSVRRDVVHKVCPKDTDGNVVDIEEFLKTGENSSKRNMLINFRMFDLDNIESIRVKLPGDVKYTGGDNIKLIAKDEIEIKSCSVKIHTIKNLLETDENGVESIVPHAGKKDANSFIGYVVYKKSLSPFEITMIVIASILLVAIIVSILLYLINLGKKELEGGDNLR